jgi:cyclic beta-1,2-glucan synthetase
MVFNGSNTEAVQIDYCSEQRLCELGESLATKLEIDIPEYARFNLIKRQKLNRDSITSTYLSTYKVAEAQALITPAAEWLLDNFYLIDENIRQIQRDLPKKYFNQLPEVKLVGGGKIPQALALARSLVLHSHCDVTISRLNAMINGFQVKKPLLIGELWAIPSLLRFVLIEELRDIALRIRSTREMRERANDLCVRQCVCQPTTLSASRIFCWRS